MVTNHQHHYSYRLRCGAVGVSKPQAKNGDRRPMLYGKDQADRERDLNSDTELPLIYVHYQINVTLWSPV